MKIQIASDLHLDLLEKHYPGYRVIEPADNADVLVIAGDIHHHARAVACFADWPVPVVYVHGNHEAYGTTLAELDGALRAASAGSNVHYLEKNTCILEGVRFLGCCLWTDYQLYPGEQEEAIQQAESRLLDHRRIRTERGMFSAADALDRHRVSRYWLELQLAQPFDGPTVVVTHHGPHPGSIHPRYADMRLNAAFVSDLTALCGKAKLWIHGHVHDSFDYSVSGTRIIANPRGYALNRLAAESPDQIQWENTLFNLQLSVKI